MIDDPTLDACFDDPRQLARIRAEAAFGLAQVGPAVAALPPGARVLEIGCGAGYLLRMLARRHPALSFEGVEPIGPGFTQFDRPLGLVAAATPNIVVHRAAIESFGSAEAGGAYDLIFSVNVFEHLGDWRAGVDRACALLAPGGEMMILCPNYAVPYEPHFRLPLLGGPRLARRLFARRIARIERENAADGLWRSLNFISVPALRRHCDRRGWRVAFDGAILGEMVERLTEDAQLAARQPGLARAASLLRRAGLAAALRRVPPALSPYMRATVSAPGGPAGPPR
jgi:SAM-dependent methyltransferase